MPTRESSGRSAKRRSACRPMRRECARRTRAGKMPPWHPTGSVPTSVISGRCWRNSSTPVRCMVTLARDACTSASTSTSRASPASRRSRSSSSAPPIWSSSHGGADLRRTRRRTGTRNLLGQDVRREPRARAFETLQVALGSRQPDEPGQGGASATPRSGPSHHVPATPTSRSKRTFAYRGDDGDRSPGQPHAAPAVGACRRTSGGTMCPSYMVAPATRNIRPADAHASSSR